MCVRGGDGLSECVWARPETEATTQSIREQTTRHLSKLQKYSRQQQTTRHLSNYRNTVDSSKQQDTWANYRNIVDSSRQPYT
jgi:hypothetical protein